MAIKAFWFYSEVNIYKKTCTLLHILHIFHAWCIFPIYSIFLISVLIFVWPYFFRHHWFIPLFRSFFWGIGGGAVVRDILNEKCSKCNSKCSCWYFLTFFWLLFPFIQRVRTCHIDSFVPLSHNVKAGLLAIYVIGILWS